MNKLLLLIVFANSCSAFAGDTYSERRMTLTEPKYGLSKVKRLIRKVKGDSEGNMRLNDKAFNSLGFNEKFTYVMIHGEDFSQNCDVAPIITHEESKIFSHIPDAFSGDMSWSERERDFLNDNRAKVIVLLRKEMNGKRVGINVKQAIQEINGYELIPDLVSAHQRNKGDLDVLTLLSVLMKEGKYKPFQGTPVYKKLYGDDSNWHTYVASTPSNEKVIVSNATAFAKSHPK